MQYKFNMKLSNEIAYRSCETRVDHEVLSKVGTHQPPQTNHPFFLQLKKNKHTHITKYNLKLIRNRIQLKETLRILTEETT